MSATARKQEDESINRSMQKIHEGKKTDTPDQGGVAVFSKDALKKHYDKVITAQKRLDDARADKQSALAAAETAGIPKAELKFLTKYASKPHGDDFKATVNIMQEMLGQPTLFDFPTTKH